jgi:hypothetical protein
MTLRPPPPRPSRITKAPTLRKKTKKTGFEKETKKLLKMRRKGKKMVPSRMALVMNTTRSAKRETVKRVCLQRRKSWTMMRTGGIHSTSLKRAHSMSMTIEELRMKLKKGFNIC